MKLEDEIKQTKPFINELQKLVINIAVTNSWLNSTFNEELKTFEISAQQYNVLRILKGKYPGAYCNQEITQRMIDKSSNSTRIVDKLLDKKLVLRIEDKKDRRLVNISITNAGLKLLEEIELVQIANQIKLKHFDLEKAKQMNDWLDELRG